MKRRFKWSDKWFEWLPTTNSGCCPGYILPIIQVTQITSSFPLPRWGISSHAPGKATAAWNKLLPLEKSHWLHLCESSKGFWERPWLTYGSMNCQPVATHSCRGENVTADWHLTFVKKVNLNCKQHPSSCLWAHRQQLQQWQWSHHWPSCASWPSSKPEQCRVKQLLQQPAYHGVDGSHKLSPHLQSSTLGQVQHLQCTRKGEIQPNFSCPSKQTLTSERQQLSASLSLTLQRAGYFSDLSPPPEGGIYKCLFHSTQREPKTTRVDRCQTNSCREPNCAQ